MTENVQLKQSVPGWKDEVLSGSDTPRSLEEITFILSAGIFGAVLANGAIEIFPACCFFAIPWGNLLGWIGGATGAAMGATRRGPIGGIGGALLGSVLGMVAVPMIDTAVPFIFFFLFPFAPAFLR